MKEESEDKLCRDLEEAHAEAALAAALAVAEDLAVEASEEADIAVDLVDLITMDPADFGVRADRFSEAFITDPITMAVAVALEA